jgi:hypothetical protein
MVRLGHADLELGVARHIEFFACAGLDPFGAAVEFVFAGATHAFHDFRDASVESQGGGQDHADRQLGAVGQGQAVADAFAVKVNIGLGVDGDAVDGLGGHGWCCQGWAGRVRPAKKRDHQPRPYFKPLILGHAPA